MHDMVFHKSIHSNISACLNLGNSFPLSFDNDCSKIKRRIMTLKWFTGVEKRVDSISAFNFVECLAAVEGRSFFSLTI